MDPRELHHSGARSDAMRCSACIKLFASATSPSQNHLAFPHSQATVPVLLNTRVQREIHSQACCCATFPPVATTQLFAFYTAHVRASPTRFQGCRYQPGNKPSLGLCPSSSQPRVTVKKNIVQRVLAGSPPYCSLAC